MVNNMCFTNLINFSKSSRPCFFDSVTIVGFNSELTGRAHCKLDYVQMSSFSHVG